MKKNNIITSISIMPPDRDIIPKNIKSKIIRSIEHKIIDIDVLMLLITISISKIFDFIDVILELGLI